MKKRKIVFIILAILVVIIAIYLNRSYARIYSKFNLQPWPQVDNLTMEKKSNTIKYLALGDSLTYGVGAPSTKEAWPALLAQKLATTSTTVELENLGVPGAMSHDVIASQLPAAITAQPQLVTLFIGVNDVHNFVSLEDYRKNLENILQTLTTKTSAKIYVINLPYLGTPTLILPPYNILFDLRTRQFNQVITEVCQAYKLQPIDIYQFKEQFSSHRNLYSADEFHPSMAGYQLWLNTIYNYVQ